MHRRVFDDGEANTDGETALHGGAKKRYLKMAAVLFLGRAAFAGADVESQKTSTGDTPLHVAVRCGKTAVAERLIDADVAALEALNHDNESPLFLAVEGGFLRIAEFIIKKCCGSLSERVCEGSNGMNALHAAVIRSHHAEIFENHVPDLSLEKLRRIIRNFVLHIEEYFRIFSPKREKVVLHVLEKLLQCEESQRTCLVRKQDNLMNWTPLHFAACLGHLEATKLILEKNPTCVACLKDNEGMSALLIAAKEGHIGVMEEIIRHNPKACEVANDRGWNVLHVAVANEKLGIVKYILRTRKFDLLLNVADEDGNTPFHLAVGGRMVWIMNALVDDIRVDKRAKNLKGSRPIDIVRTNAEIGEFMRSWFIKKLTTQGGQESLGSIARRLEHSSLSHDSKQTNDTKNTVVITSDKATRSHRLKEISNTHLLVATLIATVTLAAAFTVPGGYRDETVQSGKAMLAERPFFKAFVVADSVAFYCASASVLLQFVSSVEHNYHLLLRFTTVAAILTYVSILGMVVAFTSGLRVVMPASSMLAVYTLVMGAFCLFLFIVGCL